MKVNVRLVEELDQNLTDIAKGKNYLHLYWYNLKYCEIVACCILAFTQNSDNIWKCQYGHKAELSSFSL